MKSLIYLAPLLFFSCVTNPETGEKTINWKLINSELKAAHQDLQDVTILLEGDEELQPTMEKVTMLVGQCQIKLEAYINGEASSTDVVAVIDILIEMSDPIIEELVEDTSMKQRVKVGLILTRAVLRRVKIYMESDI